MPVIVLLLLLCACGSVPRPGGPQGQQDCPQPAHPPLTAQAFGQPCTATSECVAGLSCLLTNHERLDEAPTWGGYRTCTTACDGGCPMGGACAARALRDGGVTSFCLPSCQSDGECQSGTRAGSCTDGGVPVCEPLRCIEDRQCPSGYGCEVSVNACCPPGAFCIRGGPQDGYCRRR